MLVLSTSLLIAKQVFDQLESYDKSTTIIPLNSTKTTILRSIECVKMRCFLFKRLKNAYCYSSVDSATYCERLVLYIKDSTI